MTTSTAAHPSTGIVAMPAASASSLAASAQGSVAQSGTSNPMGSLTGNYQTFLKLLMTQLQNQDPTSPMNTDQFTSELVQFSSVEQQINTNASLTQLIQLTQAGELIQSSSMVGHSVAVTSTTMPVTSGAGAIQFTAPSAGPVTISIYNSSGAHLADALVHANQGTNTWTWNGKAANGAQQLDGLYTLAVNSTDSSGKSTSLPFSVVATATGVQKTSNGLQLQLGSLGVDFSAVQKVLN